MKPYYEHAGIVIYNGDCREVLPRLAGVDAIITDPVWPNSSKELIGADRPAELLHECLVVAPAAKRLVIHIGIDSDPRFLLSVPANWRFLQRAWLRYACPTRKGRCLYGGDIAYVFGEYPKSRPGGRVISTEYCSTKSDDRRVSVTKHRQYGLPSPEHPTPRRLQHLRWLVSRWAGGMVLDPFAGSGTTLVAALYCHLPAIGIEIEERFCEIAAKRLSQEVLQFTEAA